MIGFGKKRKEAKKQAAIEKGRQEKVNTAFNVESASINNKKANTQRAFENKTKEQIKQKLNDELNALYSSVVSNRLGDAQRDLARSLIRRCDSLEIFNTPATAQLVAAFIYDNIHEAINQANRGNALSTISSLNTLKFILDDAAKAPLYYNDDKCLDALIAKTKLVAQKNSYIAEVESLRAQKADLQAAYTEDPKKFDKNLLAQELRGINEKIDEKTKYLNEVNNSITVADKALGNMRRAFENRINDEGINIDDIIKNGLLAKGQREGYNEKIADAIDELSTDNTNVSNAQMDINTSSVANEEVDDATLEELFK